MACCVRASGPSLEGALAPGEGLVEDQVSSSVTGGAAGPTRRSPCARRRDDHRVSVVRGPCVEATIRTRARYASPRAVREPPGIVQREAAGGHVPAEDHGLGAAGAAPRGDGRVRSSRHDRRPLVPARAVPLPHVLELDGAVAAEQHHALAAPVEGHGGAATLRRPLPGRRELPPGGAVVLPEVGERHVLGRALLGERRHPALEQDALPQRIVAEGVVSTSGRRGRRLDARPRRPVPLPGVVEVDGLALRAGLLAAEEDDALARLVVDHALIQAGRGADGRRHRAPRRPFEHPGVAHRDAGLVAEPPKTTA